jgi:His/Glu/Gln/Arg/opine family amino acid ABC transporter permease subunit
VRRHLALVLFLLLACIPGLARAQGGGGDGRTLSVGLTGKFPPFNFIDESGTLTGFDIEVSREICAKTGRTCDFKILQWDGLLASLLAGKIDAIIASMAITPERQQRVAFSVPYYESGAQLFVVPGKGQEGTDGLVIGVTLGTTYEAFVRKTFPSADVRTYKGEPEIFQDVLIGRLDAVVTDKLAGAYLNRRYKAGLERRGEPLFVERIGIPVRPDDVELLGEINAAIAGLRASAKYDALMNKYFGLGTSQPKAGAAAGAARKDAEFRWGPALGLMFRGLAATIWVAFAGIATGCVLALVIAWGLIGLRPVPREALRLYVDFIRSTPFMIQLFAIYFGLPAVGVKMSAWTSAVLAIGLHSSAYLAEIIKTAYVSIPAGQHQAATTLGLTRREALVHVIWPQMLPLMLTPVLNTLVATVKDSAIVSVISVHELTMQAQQLISTSFRPLELYLLAAVLYALITYPMLLLGRHQERRFKQKGLLHDGR